MSRLKLFLNSKGAPKDIHLNLLHTANGEDFLKIIEDGKIEPSACAVFNGESLCYFFAGRPAYKVSTRGDPGYWQLPAVFVFDKLDSFIPKRVFPFDTGAYDKGLFAESLGRARLYDFELEPSWKSVSSVVENFFGSSENYVRGTSRSYSEIRDEIGENVREYIPLALSKLYNFPFNDALDDRARLIELQYDCSIPLQSPPLKGIICCAEWLRDGVIVDMLKKLDCEIKTFPILPLRTSNYYSKIYELAGELI